MGLNIEYIEGQTPIDPDEMDGLIIKTISTREELDEFEQQNIQKAIQWSIGRKKAATSILAEEYIRELHVKMLGETWKWAGEFRKTEKNIGVEKHTIGVALRQLLEDTKYWIQNNIYSPDEIAIRFKHRLVQIHCFTNGNGRHSRLMADIIVTQIFSAKQFSWGQGNLSKKNTQRNEYLKALRLADKNDFTALIAFSRS